MNAYTPSLDNIDIIPKKLSTKKTWKHFYDPKENWDFLCNCNISSMRTIAEDLVGETRQKKPDLPKLSAPKYKQVSKLLIQHHQSSYAPTYYKELSSPQTVWTPCPDPLFRHHALTPNSVFIVIQLDHPRSWIVTAYRPHPLFCNVIFDEAELRRYSAQHFYRETSVKIDEFARVVIDNMHRVQTPPTTINELWWLASAVGYGRLLNHVSGLEEALQEGEQTILKTDMSVRMQLASQLDWAELSARLGDALQDQGPEELEAVLSQAEELLAVADVLGAEEAAVSFCDEAALLLAWMPAEWAHLGSAARRRLEMFEGSTSLVVKLWEDVESATIASLLRETAPTVRSTSRLVDELIPQPGPLQRLMEQIANLPSKARELVAWIDQSLDGLTIAPYVPTMGGVAGDDAFVVCAHPAPNAPHHMVFIVDAENPDGLDVTEYFTNNNGELWLMGEGEHALLVLIAARNPLRGSTLEQVLSSLRDRDDIVAQTQELQPTHATKASR